MAENQDKEQLEAYAFELYAQRNRSRRTNESVAVDCFRDAEAFMSVAKKARAGRLPKRDDDSPLDFVRAPNLPRTHPVNLTSRAHGDLKKVQEVNEWLLQNPEAKEYSPLGWGQDEVTKARLIFPVYAN